MDDLVASIDKEGKITLDLARVVKQALQRKRVSLSEVILENSQGFGGGETPELPRKGQKKSSSSSSSSPSSSPSSRSSSFSEDSEDGRHGYGVNGWGNLPNPRYDETQITERQRQEILRDPVTHVEFIYQNRVYKLKPIGTIEPVAKRIHTGRHGARYYYKDRDDTGALLPMGKWTKVYLKNYQIQQCTSGRSKRAVGLAGYVTGEEGNCVNQPVEGRTRAARNSKTRRP